MGLFSHTDRECCLSDQIVLSNTDMQSKPCKLSPAEDGLCTSECVHFHPAGHKYYLTCADTIKTLRPAACKLWRTD